MVAHGNPLTMYRGSVDMFIDDRDPISIIGSEESSFEILRFMTTRKQAEKALYLFGRMDSI